ncbi:MAG: hypothetical protein IJ832_02375, partial [Bacteroidaceae bacterium]|nr:hypothetical protein [Bacteroidaceae bacterium]
IPAVLRKNGRERKAQNDYLKQYKKQNHSYGLCSRQGQMRLLHRKMKNNYITIENIMKKCLHINIESD